jgi:hypothetical protein
MAAQTYLAKRRIDHDGRIYEAGRPLELTAAQAEALLEWCAIEKRSHAEPEGMGEAPEAEAEGTAPDGPAPARRSKK